MPALLITKVTSPSSLPRRRPLRAGHVQAHRLHAGEPDRRAVAGRGVDLARAAGEQSSCELQAHPTVGAGDENDRILIFMVPPFL
jgi:hypothetical protein